MYFLKTLKQTNFLHFLKKIFLSSFEKTDNLTCLNLPAYNYLKKHFFIILILARES